MSYAYNAWGKVTTTLHAGINWVHPATLNPFLYRGYYYDSRFMMYYLETRWYDPMTCRFISPDGVGYLGANRDIQSNNLYLYCSNNPVMFKDDNGTDAILITDYRLNIGLPIVGHSILLLQDENGLWHMTQFAGNDIPSAKIFFDGVSNRNGKEYTMKSTEDFLKVLNDEGIESALNQHYPKTSCDRVYIHGDFTASIEKAKQYANSNDFGAYEFFTNNCCHYVHTLLTAGTADDPDLETMLDSSSALVPNSLSLRINSHTKEYSSISREAVVFPTISTILLFILLMSGLYGG